MTKEIYGIEEIVDEPKSSIEISRSTKGMYSWKIKLYSENIEWMLDKIEETDKKIRAKYEVVGSSESEET